MRIDRADDGSKVQRDSKDQKNTVSLFHTVKTNTLCNTVLHIYSILLCVLGLNNADIFKRIRTYVKLFSINPLGQRASGPYFQPQSGSRKFPKSRVHVPFPYRNLDPLSQKQSEFQDDDCLQA